MNVVTEIHLCSTSIFRQELLGKLNIPFKTLSPATDEAPKPSESPQKMVKRLSIAKAQAGLEQLMSNNPNKDYLCIGSDQTCFFDSTKLGKPGDHATAVKQLQSFSGKSVVFYTGVATVGNNLSLQYDLDTTEVKFRTLTKQEISYYLEIEQPYNCAGSFKSEAFGITLFDAIHTEDPNALIGLPLISLSRQLRINKLNPLTQLTNLKQ